MWPVRRVRQKRPPAGHQMPIPAHHSVGPGSSHVAAAFPDGTHTTTVRHATLTRSDGRPPVRRGHGQTMGFVEEEPKSVLHTWKCSPRMKAENGRRNPRVFAYQKFKRWTTQHWPFRRSVRLRRAHRPGCGHVTWSLCFRELTLFLFLPSLPSSFFFFPLLRYPQISLIR